MNKGSILFLHVERLEYVYCRFSIHRETVDFVRYLPEAKVFVSVCIELNLKVWKIEGGQIIHLHNVKLHKPIKFLTVMERDNNSKEKMHGNEKEGPEDFRLKKGVDRFIIGFKSKAKEEEQK